MTTKCGSHFYKHKQSGQYLRAFIVTLRYADNINRNSWLNDSTSSQFATNLL